MANDTGSHTKIIGSSFRGGTINGASLDDLASPLVLGDPANGNVAFPKHWTPEQAAKWREANNIAGAEWPAAKSPSRSQP